MSIKLAFNTHGKGRVRVVKVIRGRDGRHEVIQMNVQLLLEGDDMEDSFTEANNKKVIPTDTCKNTVYCIASQNEFKTIEEFGLILARHFLTDYPALVNKINIQIYADNWERISVPDSRGRVAEHKHTFKRIGPQKQYTLVTGEKRPNTDFSFSVKSGFKGLEILKTTQSGFVDFHKDRYTSLPEVADRLVGTSAEVEWTYSKASIARGGIDFNKAYKDVEAALVTTFAGPADKGIYSPSVQETLYLMGVAAVKKVSSIEEITLYMPNIHNIPFNLETYGFKNKDHTGSPHIFFPTDEPHGMIKATVTRATHSRL